MPGARFLVDHRFTRRHLSAYVEPDLEAPQRRRVERHLAECPDCDRMLRSLQRLMSELPRMSHSAPARVVAEVCGQLRAISVSNTGTGVAQAESQR